MEFTLRLRRLDSLVFAYLHSSLNLIDFTVTVATFCIGLEIGLVLRAINNLGVYPPGIRRLVLAAAQRVFYFLDTPYLLDHGFSGIATRLLRSKGNRLHQIAHLIRLWDPMLTVIQE